MKHATTCKHFQVNHIEVWKDALEESGQGSLGAQIAAEGETLEPPAKRPKNQGTLNLNSLQHIGQKAKEEQHRIYQAKVDHIIMKLMCVWGLIPHIIRVCHGYTAGTFLSHRTRTRAYRTRNRYGYTPYHISSGFLRNPWVLKYPRVILITNYYKTSN